MNRVPSGCKKTEMLTVALLMFLTLAWTALHSLFSHHSVEWHKDRRSSWSLPFLPDRKHLWGVRNPAAGALRKTRCVTIFQPAMSCNATGKADWDPLLGTIFVTRWLFQRKRSYAPRAGTRRKGHGRTETSVPTVEAKSRRTLTRPERNFDRSPPSYIKITLMAPNDCDGER